MLGTERVRTLEPLSAAGGLVAVGSRLLVIADDRDELWDFPRSQNGPGREIVGVRRSPAPPGRRARKRWKADLEALVVLPDGGVLALGSGSTPARHGGVHWPTPVGDLPARPVDVGPLHAALERELEDLNIEGACVAGDRLLLAQRGNGARGVNALAVCALAPVLAAIAVGTPVPAAALLAVHPVDALGEADDGTPLTPTDLAVLPDGRLVVCAVAEGGGSTYEDGVCGAAAVAILDEDGRAASVHRLDRPWKVEGIVAELTPDGTIELLLCVDPDDVTVSSLLLRARLGGVATGVQTGKTSRLR